MSQSLSQILVHLVFSTKHRTPLIPNDLRNGLHAYIGGVIKRHQGTLLKAGSVADHIHLLLVHPRTYSSAVLVQAIKAASCRWMQRTQPHFMWQNGYGIFSISPTHRRSLEEYIDRQPEHHRTISFQEELRSPLEKYKMKYDERFLWDLTPFGVLYG